MANVLRKVVNDVAYVFIGPVEVKLSFPLKAMITIIILTSLIMGFVVLYMALMS